MFKSMTVVNDHNESLTIEIAKPFVTGYNITAIDGLGPVTATLWHSESATSDGYHYNGGRREARTITITMLYMPDERHDIETLRHQTYRLFGTNREIELIFENDSRRVGTKGHVESNEIAIFEEKEGSSITVVCEDPWFYDASGNPTPSLEFSSVEGGFIFPFPSRSDGMITFGEISTTHSDIVEYAGEAEVGLLITIECNGAIRNPAIYNEDWDQSIIIYTDKVEAILGSPIQAQDAILISSVEGNRYVRLRRGGVDYNILNAVDRSVVWPTYHPGANTITYLADEGVDNMIMTVEAQTLYAGV